MMNTNLPSVVTPQLINYSCSTWKTLWEKKFTGAENFTLGEFSAMNMINCDHCNVWEHRDIKGSGKYVTLDILLKFDILEKMRITSSESKVKLGRSEKGLITSLGLKTKTTPKKCKNARYAIVNISKKDL